MKPELGPSVRALLQAQRIAALGTLHETEPFVSMVPFAMLSPGPRFVLHVSALAAHTRDMQVDPRVSLMVVAPADGATAPQAMARLTVQARASRCAAGSPAYAEARGAYIARFPESAPMFDFADFSLFVLEPRSARFVGGFAQAKTLTPKGLAEALAGGESA